MCVGCGYFNDDVASLAFGQVLEIIIRGKCKAGAADAGAAFGWLAGNRIGQAAAAVVAVDVIAQRRKVDTYDVAVFIGCTRAGAERRRIIDAGHGDRQ